MDQPFYYEGRIRLILEPDGRNDAGADSVSALWGTYVRDMADTQLLEFNQRASYVAKSRMATNNNQWHKLHPYDVQSVFKYLESAVYLSKKLHIVPPDDVLEARDWMANAAHNNPSKVADGLVGITQANTIIADVDSEEGNRFALLWQAIVDIESCEARKPYLHAYKRWFLNVPGNQRRERLVEVTKVPMATVESAIAQCVAAEAKEAINSDSVEAIAAAAEEVQAQIEALEAVQRGAVLPVWQRRIGSDILTLRNLLPP